jgi:hypothetical protein
MVDFEARVDIIGALPLWVALKFRFFTPWELSILHYSYQRILKSTPKTHWSLAPE